MEIRNSRKIGRRRKGRIKGGGKQKGEGTMRLGTLGNKLRASEGRAVGDWDRLVMGIKEGTYYTKH